MKYKGLLCSNQRESVYHYEAVNILSDCSVFVKLRLIRFYFSIIVSIVSLDGVTLICPQPQQCNTSTLTATCQVSSNVIAWSKSSKSSS